MECFDGKMRFFMFGGFIYVEEDGVDLNLTLYYLDSFPSRPILVFTSLSSPGVGWNF